MPASATYTKLRDGSWGVRLQGTATPGQTVTVITKAGQTKQEKIWRILWSQNDISVCSIQPRAKARGHCLCDERGCCRPRCHCERHCVCRGGNVFDCLG